MPLPSLAVPRYPVTIPSTKKQTTYRPFLMREQKMLYVALESKDHKQMMLAMCDILKHCVDGIIDTNDMPLFDIEYLFMKIRSKSVGETVEAKTKCPNCQFTNDITINLDEVNVEFSPNHTRNIVLADKLGVVMRYPCVNDAVQNIDSLDGVGMIKYIADSVEMVFDENGTYTRKDFTDEDIAKFIDSLNAAQFEKIVKFYNEVPQLRKTVNCKCVNCQNDYEISFKGLQDFFM